MSDTPETDKEEMKSWSNQHRSPWVSPEFARNLEKQRDELRNAIRSLQAAKGRHHTEIACNALFALLPPTI